MKGLSIYSRLVLAAAAVLTLAMASPVHAQGDHQAKTAPVVVELFTSQACSACPPADRLIGELAQEEGLIAISFPVDYWDHLQWQDTLGRSEHSKRQRLYARHLGLPNVYTPQIVVNGVKQVIGSHTEEVRKMIEKVRQQQAGSSVPVRITLEGKAFHLRIGPARPGRHSGEAKILVLPLLSARTVNIERGENRGRTITYYNVSREIRTIGTWRGEETTLTLAHDEVMTADADRCAVILQDERSGAILGAALMTGA